MSIIFSGADITGITINDYQVEVGNRANAKFGLKNRCRLVQGDFQNLQNVSFPPPGPLFDAAFAIESTVHSPDRLHVFRGVFDMLKPGAKFGLYEYSLT